MMRRLPVFGVLLAVILGVAYYFLLHQPTAAEQVTLESETLTLQGQQDSLRAEIALLEQVRTDAETMRADLARLQELIPSDVGQEATVTSLQQLADAAQVKIAGLAFAEPQPADPAIPFGLEQQLGVIEATMLVEGAYFQTVDFVRRLEQDGSRALLLRGVGMAEEQEEGFPVLATTLTGRFFTLVPITEQPVGTDPGAPPAAPSPAGGSDDAVVSLNDA